MTQATKEMAVGFRLPTREFTLTREKISAFHVVVSDVETGEPALGKNIHTDPEFARSVGLPDVIADGVQTSAEISRFLTDFFGDGFLRGGRLSTKFIKPVYPGYSLTTDLVITGRAEEGDGVHYDIDVFCANQEDLPVLVGKASAWVR
jgi:acyl dehydratase